MKKVLQVSKYHYPYIGGTEQVARDIVASLSDDDQIEQKIICFNEDVKQGNSEYHRKETIHDEVDGIEIIRCGCFAKISSQSVSMTYKKELKKLLSSFDPDVVILHYPNPFVSRFLLSMMNQKTKFIVYWHLDITKQKVLGKLFHRQSLALLKRADKIVVTSPNYIKGSPYVSQFESKCMVIPNCIQPDRLEVSEASKKKASQIREKYKNKTICFAFGRHVPYKGMTYLIQASKHLDDSFAVLIGGKGELTESLKKEAQGDHKVEFLGRVSDEDLIAYMLACDIFAFPSITKNEAFGIAMAECMYFSKPAVTFTIPGSGVNYVNLDGVTGIECPNGDTKAYASALKKLADDESLRSKMGQAAKQRVLDNFTFDIFKDNIKNMIAEL